MESSFGIIMLAIVNQMPQVLNLKEVLEYFIKHRKEVVVRRTIFELKKAEARLHILAGLKIALENIDEVIKIIRRSKEPVAARDELMACFALSDKQAQAILDMRLQRLTGLEREKLLEEYDRFVKTIQELKEILSDEQRIYQIIKDELKEIKKEYADPRRTEITGAAQDLSLEDLIQDEEMVVTISHGGYIKRIGIDTFKSQKRGGKGVTGMATKETDFLEKIFTATMHSYILVLTSRGRLHWLKVHAIPESSRVAKGKSIVNFVKLSENEIISAILPVKSFEPGSYLVFLTRQGVIKKTDIEAFSHPRDSGIIALNIQEGDQLIAADITSGKQDIFITTRKGMSVRFNESGLRPMGRAATGVRGIKLKKDDSVVGMEILIEGSKILTATQKGYGKCTVLSEYRTQSRGGSGIFTVKVTPKIGDVVGTASVLHDDAIMLITSGGKLIKMAVKDISTIGRNTQGVRLVSVDPDEVVTGIAIVREEKLADEGDE
jgi:DNA gyrase subunit A